MSYHTAYSIHWITQQPTPYNDYLFRTLSRDSDIDLTVHFIRSKLATHPWQSQMAQGFRSRAYHPRLGIDCALIQTALLDKPAFFVIGGWHEPTVQLLINTLILSRRPFLIWTDTPRLHARRSRGKAVLRSIWLKQVFQHAAFVMGTGQPALDALTKMGCPNSKLVNFPFFVDLDLFTPYGTTELALSSNRFFFLSSGRLENATKAHDLALRALALVQNRFADNDYRFKYLLAGDGPDKAMLQSLVKELGLTDIVEFVGWLEPVQLPDFYRGGHVLLHPSRMDNYPSAVLEAMASGLPVIASDETGVALDRIKHGYNGLIHKSDDVEDLARQIMIMVSKKEILQEMGFHARESAEEWPGSRAVEIIKQLMAQIHADRN
jgi:glycosyltransferase involved in cell wall biosynthesis